MLRCVKNLNVELNSLWWILCSTSILYIYIKRKASVSSWSADVISQSTSSLIGIYVHALSGHCTFRLNNSFIDIFNYYSSCFDNLRKCFYGGNLVIFKQIYTFLVEIVTYKRSLESWISEWIVTDSKLYNLLI